jgi:hypothetical protein
MDKKYKPHEAQYDAGIGIVCAKVMSWLGAPKHSTGQLTDKGIHDAVDVKDNRPNKGMTAYFTGFVRVAWVSNNKHHAGSKAYLTTGIGLSGKTLSEVLPLARKALVQYGPLYGIDSKALAKLSDNKVPIVSSDSK